MSMSTLDVCGGTAHSADRIANPWLSMSPQHVTATSCRHGTFAKRCDLEPGGTMAGYATVDDASPLTPSGPRRLGPQDAHRARRRVTVAHA